MNGTQLGFELAFAAAERAADHADRVHAEWTEMALAAFMEYAETHEEFATEDVAPANPHIPVPPDKRAWGHIATKAKHKGAIIKSNRTRPTKNAHAHSRDVTLWTSLICEAVTA
jgi:hypothetical protein